MHNGGADQGELRQFYDRDQEAVGAEDDSSRRVLIVPSWHMIERGTYPNLVASRTVCLMVLRMSEVQLSCA